MIIFLKNKFFLSNFVFHYVWNISYEFYSKIFDKLLQFSKEDDHIVANNEQPEKKCNLQLILLMMKLKFMSMMNSN